MLSSDSKNKGDCELKFSPGGKIILFNPLKKKLDSSFAYTFKKNKLNISYGLKDSALSLQFKISSIQERRAYQLTQESKTTYHRKKGDDTIRLDRFTLVQANKRRIFVDQQEITVFSQKRALHNDSIDMAVWGRFVGYIKDTILMDSDQFVEHNFYKKYTDTLHFYAPLLLDTIVRIKIPVKEITGIYCQREPFTTITTGASLLAMAGGLALVATSLILKDWPAAPQYGEIGVGSFLSIPISFGVGLVFSTKKFRLSKDHPNKKTWQIENHMPHPVISIAKQLKN